MSASAASSDLRAGDVDGRFVVERLAGAGGMGSVYAAQDRFDGARVALKVLRTLGQDDTARFAREAEVLRALSHPGIVRYVAHGSARGMPFLAMEWVEGEDLGERIARGPLSVDETLALGRALADALAVVHERGVVHRDLKPSNVRLSPRGPVLVDLGVARAPDLGPASVTRTGAIAVRTFHAHALGLARGPAAARAAFERLLARAAELAMPTYVVSAREAIAALDSGRLPDLR